MAGIIGTLDKFEINGTEPFTVYLERLELFCEANGITEAAKKKAVFLSGVGIDTYKLVRNLCTPAEPKTKSLAEIIVLLKNHLAPDPNSILERFKFNKRDRKDGESVADYIAELRNLSRDCEYGDQLEEMLRDRLVCGIGDVNVQKKLLSEGKTLDFTKAQAIALSSEASAKHSKSLSHGASGESQIHKVDNTANYSGKKATICFRCGDTRHSSDNCLFKNKTCFACDKVGHISRVCRTKQSDGGSASGTRNTDSAKSSQHKSNSRFYQNKGFPKSHNTRNVDHEGDDHCCSCSHDKPGSADDYREGSVGGLYNLYKCVAHQTRDETGGQTNPEVYGEVEDGENHPMHHCGIQREEPIYTTVQVNDVPIKFEVDTGASLTVIGAYQYKQHLSDVELQPTDIRLKTYSGEFISPMGVVEVAVEQNGEVKRMPLVVTPGDTPSLVGRNWLKNLKLDWAEIF